MKKFMLAHVRDADLKLFLDMSHTKAPKQATDVAISNTFGPNTLKGFKVWAEEKA